ncbi:MAG: imidazole glycerol phosphate synthase, glutamine amidotransferase subunit [Bacteroidetes bacterium RBG_13_43_22]|nr:MAG: imidazole glycerol phosphate synthase, glutamine amidotransferase subunit [Bacteroidetes bacterium RBG_13_43_22]
MITIIDYKTGNLGSIQNMLKKIRVESIVTSDPHEIASAAKIILPGVGAFDQGMKMLENLGLKDILSKKALEERVPVMGICLGMQLMTQRSEEGTLKGLGWIEAETVRFRFKDTSQYKSPHMGWNFIRQKKDSRLLTNMQPDSRFYFVHSYYIRINDPADILTTTSYETEFTSSFERDNILGVQFHPEKSHKFGMTLLRNFAELY